MLQAQITMKVINGLYPGVTTVELDNLAAEICATNATKHPDFTILAARIAVSNLHKETKKVFSGKNIILYLPIPFPKDSTIMVLISLCMFIVIH